MSIISRSFAQHDRVAIALMLGTGLLIGLLLLQHDKLHTSTRFWLAGIKVETKILPLHDLSDGYQKKAWGGDWPASTVKLVRAGRRMACCLALAPYGTEYQVQLDWTARGSVYLRIRKGNSAVLIVGLPFSAVAPLFILVLEGEKSKDDLVYTILLNSKNYSYAQKLSCI